VEQLEKGQNYFAHSVNPQLLSSVFLGHGRRVAEQERDGRELREREKRELQDPPMASPIMSSIMNP
jgi:hypothetical protein